jgi:hypothetical protein
MERRSFETIVQALDAAGVRHLVAGGLAVVAHGHLRFTADLDLVLDPDPAALRAAIAALEALGYRPRAPVPFAEFADPGKRFAWARDKGMTVFSASSPAHPATEIDLFLEPPVPFDEAYARARRLEIAPGVVATFVGLADLLAMKRAVGRPHDLQDVAALEALQRAGEEPNGR